MPKYSVCLHFAWKWPLMANGLYSQKNMEEVEQVDNFDIKDFLSNTTLCLFTMTTIVS